MSTEYVDSQGQLWTWHEPDRLSGGGRFTKGEGDQGSNYAHYFIEERYGPLTPRAVAEQVSTLTAENERLRKERDEQAKLARDTLAAAVDEHIARALNAERALSSLRELESAARGYRDARFTAGAGAAGDRLVAAVDALPPTPPATESSDV